MWMLPLVAGAGVLTVFALVYRYQEALLFYPERLPDAFQLDIPQVEEIRIPVDGAVLTACHLKQPQSKGVVFFLHGNAGNIRDWFVNLEIYRNTGFDLFMIDYRGYGKSTGRIQSEAQLRADVDAAWERIAPAYRGRRVVVYGRSLGSGLAAHLSSRIQPDLTILVSPYWSIAELARRHHPYLPGLLLRYPLKTFEDIGHIRTPILLIHGEGDRLIPFEHSVRLQAAARDARLVCIRQAAHNDLQNFDEYNLTLTEALRRVAKPAQELSAANDG